MDTEQIQQIVLLYVVLLVSLVVHEASHALVALLGGDRTAYLGGQVTLNPIPHIRREPFGTMILPLVMLLMTKGSGVIGYAHAPYDPIWAYRHPKRAALMAAAGPVSNFLLCAIAFAGLKILVAADLAGPGTGREPFLYVLPFGDSAVVYATAKILSAFLFLNLLLGIFNLVPWPPLDGAAIVEGLAGRGVARFFGYIRTQPILMLLVLILGVWRLLPVVFEPVFNWVYRAI